MFKWLTGGGDDNEFRRGPKKGQPEPKAGLGKYEKTATGVRFKLTMDGSPIKPTKHIPAKTTLSVPAKRQTAKMKDGSYKSIESAGKLISNTSPPNPVTASFGHAFVGAVLEAYSGHHTLKIRPDDVWLTLMVSFAKFIDAKPEQLRKCFVEHEGKKELVIVAPGNFYTLDWPSISRKFSDLIAKNTKDSVREWVEPDFSTTTAHDRFVGGVLLMGAMKNYFSYGLRTMCGIPCVEMEGTLEDWTKLRLKIDRFKKYGEDAKSPELVKWHRILVPIFDEFVQSFKGEINPDFWQRLEVEHQRTFQGGSMHLYLSTTRGVGHFATLKRLFGRANMEVRTMRHFVLLLASTFRSR